jgi:hypothetical protein
MNLSILKGFDDGVMHFEESCFRTLSIVQCFFFKKTTFRKLALLPSSGKKRGRVAPTLWGSLQRASLNHLNYLNTEVEPAYETLFFKRKRHWTMDKVKKQDSSKFRIQCTAMSK